MTTRTYTSVIDHTGDAGFQAWYNELISELIACGLVQTADTGQIGATAARPGTNTAAGYVIMRLADSSLYFKIEFGTASSSLEPQIWLTVGTGSNGSGTLTGQTSTRDVCTTDSAPFSTATPYTTYLCVVDDALAVVFKTGSSSSRPLGFFCVGRTTDSDGNATSIGYAVMHVESAASVVLQCVRTASPAATYAESQTYCIVPGEPSTSVDADGNLQAYPCWLNVPEVLPWLHVCGIVNSDYPLNSTFGVTLFGSTEHTYLAVGPLSASIGNPNDSSTYGYAVIFE